MKIVVFGLGSIGRRHLGLLKAAFAQHEVFAFRSGKKQGPDIGVPQFFDWKKLEAVKPDVAFICTPTHTHVPLALQCARRGMHLFIEKPLSHSSHGIAQLKRLVKEKKLTAYVAYGLRFHPVILRLKELLKGREIYHARAVCASLLHRWRPQAKGPNYSYYKAQGGGVILDLSHEFDYIQYLFGPIERIQGRHGRRSKVTVDSEDYCDALVTIKGAGPVTVHLNIFSLRDERRIIVETKGENFNADLLSGEITIQSGQGRQVLAHSTQRDEWMAAQTQYFFDHINDPKLMNNLNEADELLKKILEFRNG